MKAVDDLERRIGQMNEPSGQDLDERVIADMRKAFADAPRQSTLLPIKLLAAAAIIAAVVFLGITLLPREPESPEGPRAVLSVGEMLTVKHMNVTYRRGGMQALNALCEEAGERVDLEAPSVSMRDLLAELNGT